MAQEIPVKIDDFSGGVADFPLYPTSKTHAKLDNFIITDEKKAQVCKGSRLVDPSLDQVKYLHPEGQTSDLFYARISEADKLLVRVKGKLFSLDDERLDLYETSKDPFYTGDLPLTNKSEGNFVAVDDHIYGVAAEKQGNWIGSSPVKIYRKPTGEFRVINSGMPEIKDDPNLLTNMLALANEIKVKFNTHIATADHKFSSGSISADDATDAGSLLILMQDIREKLVVHFSLSNAVAINTFHAFDVEGTAIFIGKQLWFYPDGDAASSSRYLPYSAHTFQVPEIPSIDLSPSNLLAPLNTLKLIYNLHVKDVVGVIEPSTGTVTFKWLHSGETEDGASWDNDVSISDIRKNTNLYLSDLGLTDDINLQLVDSTVTDTDTWSDDWEKGLQFGQGLLKHFNDTYGDAHAHNFPEDVLNSPFAQWESILVDTSSFYNAIVDKESLITFFFRSVYYFMVHMHRPVLSASPKAYYHEGTSTTDPLPTAVWGLVVSRLFQDPDTVDGAEAIHAAFVAINGDGNAYLPLHALDATMHRGAFSVIDFYGGSAIWNPNFIQPSLALLWSRTYSIFSGDTLLDRGAPYVYTFGARSQDTDLDVGMPKLYKLPILSDEENWPVGEMSLEIYRSADASAGYYKLATLKYNSDTFPTLYVDINSKNSTLITKERIYTDDGTAPNGQPPKCVKISHVGNHMYYGGILQKDGAGILRMTNYIYQSKNSNYDAVPGDFYLKMPYPWISQGKVRDNLVVITTKGVYRIDGTFTDVGGNGMVSVEIDPEVGGVSYHGAVEAGDLLYFAGTDGFYRTDGYKVQRISRHLREKFSKLVAYDSEGLSKGRLIRGAYSATENRIYWIAAENSDNYDTIWILDLNQPISVENESACFTMRYGTSIKPSAITSWDGSIVRGDIDGWVFIEDPNLYSDVEINRTTGELTGARRHIEYDLLSGLNDFGDSKVKKYGTPISFDFAARGIPQLSVVPYYVSDNGRIQGDMHEINYNAADGDKLGFVSTRRKINSGGIRFHWRQLGLKPDSIKKYSSSDYSNLSIVAGKILELSSGAWPLLLEGMIFYLAYDSYMTGYIVKARLSDTQVQVEDTNNTLPTVGTSTAWVIEEYPKTERLEVLSMDMSASLLGSVRQGYSEGDNKANG